MRRKRYCLAPWGLSVLVGCFAPAENTAMQTSDGSSDTGGDASDAGPVDGGSTDDGGPFDPTGTGGSTGGASDSADTGGSGGAGTTGEPSPTCGDGNVDPEEICDDGNARDGDGCESDCTPSTGVRSVHTGTTHACALFFDGAVRCWGYNEYGELGYGHIETIGDDEAPSTAGEVELDAPATALALGSDHTCALLNDGSVTCWGRGETGRLGYGNTESIGDDETPAGHTVNLGGAAVALASGGAHTCAIVDDGALRCWGGASNGQLGYGNTNTIGDDESPAAAGPVDIGGDVVDVSTYTFESCAVRSDGAVLCWGHNLSELLGYPNLDDEIFIGDDETPASVGPIQLGGPAQTVAVGAFHRCALMQTGDPAEAVRCWAENHYGAGGHPGAERIGDDEHPDAVAPVALGDEPIVQLEAGTEHTCAVFESGRMRCFGRNNYGQLGIGSTTDVGDDEAPVDGQDVVLGVDVTQVSAGFSFTCARTVSSTVRCWGQGSFGRLGYGNELNIGDDEAPSQAGDVPLF